MKDHDTLQRFIFDGTDIRGEIVTLADSYRDILAHASYPEPVSQLLGEFLAAASLLGATLKHRGIITVQARGNGALSAMMAECTYDNHVRGIARGNFEEIGENTGLQQLLGGATLAITIDPEKGERYQGIVPLEADTLSQCLEHYFSQSEQLPTKISLSAGHNSASGILIQKLPDSTSEITTIKKDDDWQHIAMLLETLTPEEQLTLSHNDQLYRLFHQEKVRLFDAEGVSFACSCSRQRTEKALLALGNSEISKLSQEQGLIIMNCQFCHQEYRFTEQQVNDLLSSQNPNIH